MKKFACIISGQCPTMNREHSIEVYYVEIPKPRSKSCRKITGFFCDNNSNCSLDSECPIFNKAMTKINNI